MRMRFTMALDDAPIWVDCARVVAHYTKTSAGLRGTMLLLDGGHEVMVLEPAEHVRDHLSV